MSKIPASPQLPSFEAMEPFALDWPPFLPNQQSNHRSSPEASKPQIHPIQRKSSSSRLTKKVSISANMNKTTSTPSAATTMVNTSRFSYEDDMEIISSGEEYNPPAFQGRKRRGSKLRRTSSVADLVDKRSSQEAEIPPMPSMFQQQSPSYSMSSLASEEASTSTAPAFFAPMGLSSNTRAASPSSNLRGYLSSSTDDEDYDFALPPMAFPASDPDFSFTMPDFSPPVRATKKSNGSSKLARSASFTGQSNDPFGGSPASSRKLKLSSRASSSQVRQAKFGSGHASTDSDEEGYVPPMPRLPKSHQKNGGVSGLRRASSFGDLHGQVSAVATMASAQKQQQQQQRQRNVSKLRTAKSFADLKKMKSSPSLDGLSSPPSPPQQPHNSHLLAPGSKAAVSMGRSNTALKKSQSFADIFKQRAQDEENAMAQGSLFSYQPSQEELAASPFALPSGTQTPSGVRQQQAPVSKAKQHALSIMAKHTFEEGRKQQLICDIFETETDFLLLQGVALRVSKGNYAVYPPSDDYLTPWITALCLLNVESAITLATTVTEGIIDMIPPDSSEVVINASTHIQVLGEACELALARKAQGAAFILSEKCVVIWSDEGESLLADAQKIHEKLTRFLWSIAASSTAVVQPSQQYFLEASSVNPSGSPSNSFSTATLSADGTTSSFDTAATLTNTADGSKALLKGASDDFEKDVEADGDFEERTTMVLSSVTHGFACALAILISGLSLRQALVWTLLDQQWSRMAIAAICPIYFIVVMFFCDNIINYLFMLVGPVRQLQHNSRYFSGIGPKPMTEGPLPHITIQMPVYKEDFDFVLKPSFESIKKAIRTYELQGGSASIIVSEDGIVLVDAEEREKRLAYYEDNNITWIGRPKHGKDGFHRAGRFKKASNLNFTYDVLLKTEKMIEERLAFFPPETTREEAYTDCLRTVLGEIHPDACASGVDHFGEYVLMIDSDTRLPEDCFLDAASEMTRNPDVGILQHCSGVMIVSTSFFEKCIAYFTRLVNFAISYAVANGDMAPFMGHNAYLRWSAMQEIGRLETGANGQQCLKVWSEDHVSEDFVMALDMIERGYIVRWATYSNSEYMEGVSLSCDDELNRWQKYAWGVSEMIFTPLTQWWKQGPWTPLFRRFLFGCAPIHYKWASMSYCFSYYAIGLAFPLTFALVLIQGWMGGDAGAPYIPSFQVLVACIVVFSAGGTLALTVVRFRAGYGSLLGLAFENFAYLPFLVVFFGGLSYHVSTALISHFLGIDMTWGATLKDIEMTNFFAEAPIILKRHYRLFILCFIVIGGVSALQLDFVPLQWRLEDFFVLFPVYFLYSLHLVFPIALNPSLIRFSF